MRELLCRLLTPVPGPGVPDTFTWDLLFANNEPPFMADPKDEQPGGFLIMGLKKNYQGASGRRK